MTCKENCTCPNCVLEKISGKKKKIPKCPRCNERHNPDEKNKCAINMLRKFGKFNPGSFNPYKAFDPLIYERISEQEIDRAREKAKSIKWSRYSDENL